MIKFNLLRPDEDVPEPLNLAEEENLQEEDPIPVREMHREIELDETLIGELEEYKQERQGIRTFGEENEEKEDEEEEEEYTEEVVHRWGLMTGAAVVVLLAAFWLAHLLGYLPDTVSRQLDKVQDRIMAVFSKDEVPEDLVKEIVPVVKDTTAKKEIEEEMPPQFVADDRPDTVKAETKDEYLPEPVPVTEKRQEAVQEVFKGTEPRRIAVKDYEALTRIAARSSAFIAHNLAILDRIPNTISVTTLSSTPFDLLLECNTPESAALKNLEGSIQSSGMFSEFRYLQGTSIGTPGKRGIYQGEYTLQFDPSARELYDLNSDRFLRHLGDIGSRNNMTFSDLRSFTVPNDHDKVKSTLYQISFDSGIENIRSYLLALREMSATYALEKLYLSRETAGKAGDPLRFTLYISLYESGE